MWKETKAKYELSASSEKIIIRAKTKYIRKA